MWPSNSFYEAMGVREDAPMNEICQAYQRYAPLCHPDSNDYNQTIFPIKNLTQQEYWLLLNEAFEVLTNAEWRARYNVGTLKQHHPVYEFSGDCMGIYQKFSVFPRSVLVMPSDGTISLPEVLGMAPILTVPKLTFLLGLELEEMFYGAVKTFSYPRMMHVDGRYQTLVQTLAITITPYMRPGGTFTIKGCGHEIERSQGDVVVVLRLNPHPYLTIVGDDLVYNTTVPLSTALFGGNLTIKSFDGKSLTTYLHPPFPTAYPLVRLFDGEGMRTLTGRGNLIVNIYPELPLVPLHMRTDVERTIREVEQFMVKAE